MWRVGVVVRATVGVTLMAVATSLMVNDAVATPPDSAPTSGPDTKMSAAFDVEGQTRRYNAWVLQWLTKPLDGKDGPLIPVGSPFTAMRALHDDLPDVGMWPFDEARGMLVNDIERRVSSLSWIDVGPHSGPDPRSDSESWARIALSDWSEPTAIRAVMCIPEACYFKSSMTGPKKGRVVIRKPGIWIALRKQDGKDVLAGILIHKTAPKKPIEDKLFKKWLTELGTRFPLPLP